MKKIYYNLQLISIFLLNKTYILFFIVLLLLNGNNIISLVFCDETIENLTENEISQEKKNANNNLYLYCGFALVIGVIVILYYYYGGGDGKDPGTFFSKKSQPLPLDYLYGHTRDSAEIQKLSTQLADMTAKFNSVSNVQSQLRVEHNGLQNFCARLQENQTDMYGFLEKLMVRGDRNLYKDIAIFLDRHPMIPPRIF